MSIRDARFIEGSEEARSKVVAFLEDSLARGVDVPEGDVSIRLVHKTKTGELEIGEFPFAVGENPSEVASEILDVAEKEASQWTGKTRFGVRVEGRAKVCTFTLDVPKIEEDEDDDIHELEELPNKRGILGQQMRHNEKLMTLALTSANRSTERDSRRISELEAQVNHLTARLFEANKLIEEARNLAFMRDMEVKRFESEQARKDQVAGGLMAAGKMIATSYMQKQGLALPEAPASPNEEITSDLIASLEKDPERMAKIGELLSPMEIAMLMQLKQNQMDRAERESAAAQAVAAAQAHAQAQAAAPAGPPQNGTTPGGGASYKPWTPSGV